MLDQATPKRIAWGPVAAILGGVLLFFGGQIFAAILITVVLAFAGWNESRIEAWFTGGNTEQFIFSAVVAAVTLGALSWYLSFKRAHPRDVGLVRPKIRDIGYVLLGAGAYIVSYILLVSAIAKLFPSLNTEQTQELGFQTTTASNELLVVFMSLVVLAPLVEEIVVRGFMFSGLRSKVTFWPAAIISSGLFGLAHLLGGEGGSTIWIATIDTFILGMVLAYLREKTDSLWAPIGLHALKNFVAFMALFVLKIG